MTSEPVDGVDTALVEVAPGTVLAFGRVPDGVDLVPLSLISQADQRTITSAIATSTGVLNNGAQLINGLGQIQGLVRLAPETLRAMQAGATPVQSGGYNIGVLAQNGKFAAQIRWLPAGGAQAVGLAASIGPAMAMLAIQIQLNEISGLVRKNLALTEAVLKSVRHEQWAELTGLEGAVSRALDEAKDVGEVTPLLWENVAGYEAGLRKHRDLFRRHVEAHAADLAARSDHVDRRRYLEGNGEAILLDAHSLLIAHKAWFQYQALRAGRARLEAADDSRESALLETIVERAKVEYEHVVGQVATLVGALNREVWILSELPGKRTIPFTGARRSARDVASMAQQMLDAIERLSDAVQQHPEPLSRPTTIIVDDIARVDADLKILRWHLAKRDHLTALLTADEGGTGEVVVALTQRQVIVGKVSEFRRRGLVRHVIANEDIRYVRLRTDRGDRAEIDLATKDRDYAWRLGRGSASDPAAKAVAALLADHMRIPADERRALRTSLPPWTPSPNGLIR